MPTGEPENVEGLSTAELSARLEAQAQKMEAQQRERHEMNNRIQRVFGAVTTGIESASKAATEAMSHISVLSEKQDKLSLDVRRLDSAVTDLTHVVLGVGGEDGMRTQLREIAKDQRELAQKLRHLDARLAVVVALVSGGTLGAFKLFGG